jgi:hypothetical protein
VRAVVERQRADREAVVVQRRQRAADRPGAQQQDAVQPPFQRVERFALLGHHQQQGAARIVRRQGHDPRQPAAVVAVGQREVVEAARSAHLAGACQIAAAAGGRARQHGAVAVPDLVELLVGLAAELRHQGFDRRARTATARSQVERQRLRAGGQGGVEAPVQLGVHQVVDEREQAAHGQCDGQADAQRQGGAQRAGRGAETVRR